MCMFCMVSWSPYITFSATDGNFFFSFLHTKLKHMLFLIILYDVLGTVTIFFMIKRFFSPIIQISTEELQKDNSRNYIDFQLLL